MKPPIPKVKKQMLSVRMTPEQSDDLKAISDKTGMSKAGYMLHLYENDRKTRVESKRNQPA